MALFPMLGPAGLLFCQNGAGSPLVGNAGAGTATLLSKQSTTYPLPSLDAGYFAPGSGTAKGLLVVAQGIISSVSANSQTLTVGLGLASSDTTTINSAFASGAFTPQASLSSATWQMQVWINPTAVGTSGTLQGIGSFSIFPTAGNATATGLEAGIGGSATFTQSTEAAAFIQVYATWTNANTSVSNTLTCYQVFVFALNTG